MSAKLEIIKLKYRQMSTEKLQETFDLYSELQSMSTTDQIHYDCICQELDKR